MTDAFDVSRPKSSKDEKYLYVILHGFGSSKLKLLQKLFPQPFDAHRNIEVLGQTIKAANLHDLCEQKKNKNVRIYCPNFNRELSVSSTAELNDLVAKILRYIDIRYKKENYANIYIIGYSTGAILARKVYICACGSHPEIPLEGRFNAKPKEWADKVDRLVLLAGINRGWSINHHLSLPIAALWTLGAGWGNLIMLLNKKKPIIFKVRRGASFLTELCIQWLYMRKNSLESGLGDATTIQLLGTQDTLISPEDNIDPISGQDFIYLEIPFSNHTNVINLDLPPDKNKSELSNPQKRGAIFLSALQEDPHILKSRGRPLILNSAFGMSHRTTATDAKQITDVIFVIHGIRDEGHWTNKIAQRVIIENQEANLTRSQEQQRHFAIETSRYGYFPMLLFALPWTRRAKVAWFMDQYAENLALYPNAKFSFIGHSNGTYLLAQALEEYNFCRFHRVVFAGSVVPKEYQWSKHINNNRVDKVLNYVATFDWVVAIFPNFLHWFQSDLGSAGHDGFQDNHKYVKNIKYIKGQHGAALNEYNWNAIAKFIVSDEPDASTTDEEQPPEIFQETRGETGRNKILERLLEGIGKFPWLVIIAIFAIVSAVGVEILFYLSVGEWQKTCIFIVYGWAIWKILTII